MPGSRQTTKTDTMSQSVNSGDVNFVKHLIYETSFHFDLEKMNLVICDDNTSSDDVSILWTFLKLFFVADDSNRNGNGALLITLKQIEADHYPSHKAGKFAESQHVANLLSHNISLICWVLIFCTILYKQFE